MASQLVELELDRKRLVGAFWGVRGYKLNK